VDPEGLVKAGLIKNSGRHLVKILGGGELGHALTVRAHAVSDSAKNKIESKGGSIEMLPTRTSAS
jgi:large subunit ribosomal protein L15